MRVAAVVALLIAAAGLALVLTRGDDAPERGPGSAAGARPNVVVIMTDDQTLEGMRALPRTRRLIGERGVSFDSFYVTDPLCCPSRATFLTGSYAHNTGVISNGGPNGLAALDEASTLAPWLQESGYRTAFVGKYLNGYGLSQPRRVPPGWDDWHALLEPTTHDVFDYELNENGTIRRYEDRPSDYKTSVLGRLAVASVRRAARAAAPFFLYVGFNAPHAPSTPAPRDAGTQSARRPARGPAFDEADLSDKPSFLRDRPRLDAAAEARIDSRYQLTLESLAAVDRQVRRIVAALDAAGELERTYVIFTSDNGYIDGEHRIEFGKLLAYDPASHVPLLIRGPGLPRGERSSELVANVDLAPTIAAIAGAEPDHGFDGRSLLGAADEGETGAERGIVIESLVRDRSAYYGIPYRALRTERYLYVRYRSGDQELYDLARDPHELESRHDDPRYAPLRRALAAELARLRDCAGAECSWPLGPLPDPPPAG